MSSKSSTSSRPQRHNQKISDVAENHQYSDFLAPKYWTTWLAIGMVYLAAYTPWRIKIAFSRMLCGVVKKLAKSRYRTLTKNIRACFSELPRKDQDELIEKALFSNILGIFETAHALCRATRGLAIHVEGYEHFQQAEHSGKPIMILSSHFSMLDLGAAMLGEQITTGTIYRKHDNPLFNYFIVRSREKYVAFTVARKDMNGFIERLKNKETIAYLPDQDFGKKRSIFVPFFGVQAATLPTTSELAEATGATIIPVSAYRVGVQPKYVLRFHAPLNIPTDDHVQDTITWTTWLENCIREYPDQYLWMHKRFKTRPEGEEKFY